MASKNTSSNSRQAVQRSNSDSARWIAGLLLLFIGLFAAAAVFFSFFSWAADQSGLQKSVEERVTLGIEPENLCGWAGARLGMLLVDHSFGLFGILIPAMIVLVGVRIVRQRPLLFNHSILSLFLIMILGSLTLGFAFADRWSLCCSTGWGGAFGIASSALLRTHIGAFGTLILLVGGWILTGVFINRNFINKVNEAGNVVEVLAEYDPLSRGGDPADGRKVKGATLHWVDAATAVDAEVRLYDNLFTDANPDAADKDFIECLNPGSLEVLTDCKVEAGLAAAADRYAESHEAGKTAPGYQFMRLGYFCPDNKDSTPEHPVFNRSVSLKDSYKPQA